MCVGDEKTLKYAADVVEPSNARPIAMGVSFLEWKCDFHSRSVDGIFSLLAIYEVLCTKAHSLAFCSLFNYLQLKTVKTVGGRFMGQQILVSLNLGLHLGVVQRVRLLFKD